MKKLISPLLFVMMIILIIVMIDTKTKCAFAIVSLEEEMFEQSEEIKTLESIKTLQNIVIEKQDEVIRIQDEIIEEHISNTVYLGEYTVTAYCSCATCCGKWATYRQKDEYGNDLVYGAGGELLVSGTSVACNLPFGTVIIIDNKEYVVNDRTSDKVAERYQGKIIDIYFNTHQEAVDFAKQVKDIYIKNNLEI